MSMTKAHLPPQPPVLPGSPGADRKGLLWILDEEVLVPGSGDSAAFDRLCSYFATKGPDQEGKSGSAAHPLAAPFSFGTLGNHAAN